MEKPKAAVAAPQQYLTFFLVDEEYAIDILRVREVIEYAPLTRVPSMPASIRGVLNLRGRVVAVVDLASKFGLGERPVSHWTCFVVVEVAVDGEATPIGLWVDAVSQVLEIAPTEIEPAPTFGTRVRADYLRGMARLDRKFALILDAERLLSIDELLAVTAVTAVTVLEADAAQPAEEKRG